MGLLSIFKRQADAPNAPRPAGNVGEAGDEVQRARTRARQRLIGAAVLLGIGIVGFPLVFETQPRPIPVNIPIEAPARDGAPALTMPAARPAVPAPAAVAPASTPSVAAARPAPAPAAEVSTESREEAGRAVAAAPSAASVPASVASRPAAVAVAKPAVEPKTTPRPESKPETKPEPKAEAKATAATDSARARALLEGKTETPADAGRFVVQVGAFADQAAARETRMKAEKLGLKTYTQVATTPEGKRIRVRAGPFNTRAEADRALAKARSAGLTAVVLTL